MTKKQKEITGLILLIFSIITIFCLATHEIGNHPAHFSYEEKINKPFGAFSVWISHVHFLVLGYTSVIIPLMMGILGYIIFSNKKIEDYKRTFLYISLFGIWISIFIACIGSLTTNDSFYNHAGLAGYSIFKTLRDIIGKPGVCIFLLVSILILLSNLFDISLYQLFKNVGLFFSRIFSFIKRGFIYLYDKIKNFRKKPEIIHNEIYYEELKDEKSVKESHEDKNDVVISSGNEDIINNNENENNEIISNDESLEEIEIEPEDEVIEGDLDAHQKQN